MTDEIDNVPFRQYCDADGKKTRQAEAFERFHDTLERDFIEEGLTAEIDSQAVPTNKIVPANRLCADYGLRVWARPQYTSANCSTSSKSFNAQFSARPVPSSPTPGKLLPSCATTKWTPARATDPTVQPSGPSGAVGAVAVVKPKESPHRLDPCTNAELKDEHEGDPRAGYELCVNRSGFVRARIYLRSAYSVYEYLGRLLDGNTVIDLRTADEGIDRSIINIDQGSTADTCFAKVMHNNVEYCVPNSAVTTKQVFSLMRQLVNLYSSPATQPNTQTVRTTPN